MNIFLRIIGIVLVFIINAIAQPEFTDYSDGNPVIPKGRTGSWDAGAVWAPTMSVVNDTFYLTYQGTRNYKSSPMGIGLATSTDGYNFTKSLFNPILSGDGSGFDAYAVGGGPLIYDNGSWYLYYSGIAAAPNIPGNVISRAIADNPHGPWTQSNDTLLTTGSNGAWDDKSVLPLRILPMDTGLVMYYMGSDDWYPNVFKCQIGIAISTDGGQTWQKYDDPATTDLSYAESDPILKSGPEIFDDDGILGAGIIKNGKQWEMLNNGIGSDTEAAICFATSPDGINWEKYSKNPIYTFWDDASLAVHGFIESPTVALYDSRYFLYYDYGIGASGIGLATALRLPKIINVPDEFNSIQEAINAAADGDTVLVLDSTYYENINFKGKAILVASHFVLDQDTSHISKTIIDGSQHSDPDSGSVVYFASGEDTTSVLMGFTITGGTGTFESMIPPAGPPIDTRLGGGIYVDSEKGSRITWNIIENNSVVSDKLGVGGGITAGDPTTSTFNIIENNIIRNNSVSGELDYISGGAIFMGSNGRICNNTISENLCQSVNYGVAGGAIRLLNMDANYGARYCLIEDNIIENNQAVSEHSNSFGGAVASAGIRITLKHNQIISNTAKGHYDYSGGGGLYIGSLLSGQHVIEGNLFLDNKLDGAYYGGGIALYNSAPVIINNIFYSNSARYGGGLFLDNSSSPQTYNNTFFDNSASNQGGGIYSRNSILNVMNTIIWNNSAPTGAQIYSTGGSANITYSNIQGGWSGDGNMNVDPYFCTDTLFCLSDTSACIDAGNPGREFNDIEDPENLTYPLWPAKGTLRNDMGVYGWYKLATAIDPDNKEKQIPLSFVLHQNYPNPFNPVTTIEYQLPNANQVDLSIYNILGQRVATLVSARQPAGNYRVGWDATDLASGIYYYQLQAGKFVQTKKLVLIR